MIPIRSRTVIRVLIECLSLWLLAVSAVSAVDLRNVLTGYTFTSWSRKDGLVGPVWAITQDPNGFLWLGTDSGLTRFDGVRFVTWEGLGGQPLPRLPIRALFTSSRGSLWVGFGGTGGVARIDNRTVTTFVDAQRPDFTGPVTAILESANGTVWVSSATGLHRTDGDNDWKRLGVGDGLPAEGYASAFVDRSERLWVSTPEGLYRRDRADSGPFARIDTSADPQRPLAFSEDAEGRLWTTDSLVGFRSQAPGPAVRSVEAGRGYRLLHDRNNQLWVATIGQGLWRVRPGTGASSPGGFERTTVLSGLSSDAVRAVFEDRDGNIWAGTTDGVDRLVPNRVVPFAGLGIVNTLDVSTDGRVWAGTADELIPFSNRDGTWAPLDSRTPVRGATAIRGSSAGGLWVTTPNTLFRVVGPTATPIPAPRTETPLAIEALATDSSGEAWLVTSNGDIYRTESNQLRLHAHVDALDGARTNSATMDHADQLWVLFANSRVGLLRNDGTFKPLENAGLGTGLHYDAFTAADGVVWICGTDGLSRYQNDRFTLAGQVNGLPLGGVYSATQDERGTLWLAAPSGIIRLELEEFDRAVTASSPYQMRFRTYDTSDGLAGYPVALGDRNAIRAADGTLWFITSRGISVADPRRLTPQRQPPLVAIDSVRADDAPVAGTDLAGNTSKIQIDFTAPELTSPLKTRFRYRLEGVDQDWVDAGTRREALYTGLGPGDFRFRVSVSQDDGSWSETEATYAFTLHPQFYQTWWFAMIVGATIAALVWSAWQVRIRQLRRQFALVLGERVRLSRELHDTLLQSLVGVALEFDAVSRSLEGSQSAVRDRVIKIREQVEEYIREARRSIWSLRSPALETGDLIEALRDSATRATAGQPVTFSFEQTGVRRRLPSNIEHQLLRIGQEAMLNAVRHSGATTITMHLRFDEDAVELTVTDDGRGFDSSLGTEGTTDHYGLTTMRERAEQAGGRLLTTSTPGHGTRISARVPTLSTAHPTDDD